MRDAGRRPMGRLFYWALLTAFAFGLSAFGAGPQSGPATTTISDTVYLADGTTASGTLIITWPAFVTSGGTAVAAGSTTVTLGTNGALNVALVPNAGATPAGMYYSVVYQLQPGEVRTEYWVVPSSTSPVTVAQVITTPGSGQAAAPVSLQYVNTQLATKANDNAVVHLANAETITGVKTFSANPNVPAPVNPNDVANKSYVDTSVENVGAGNYLPTAGGTMTGPITLPGNPSAPLQAAPKQYVDASSQGKADLILGYVPTSELGSGTATAGSCLLGGGSSAAAWGSCGTGTGTGNVSTTPVANQNVTQPEGTEFSTNNLANVRYVTASWNWSQTPSASLATPGSNTVTLTPCPAGINTSANANEPYYVYVAGGTGTAEAALVTGGTCTPGAASGTIVITTVNAHTGVYTVGSSTSGIQEALNDAGALGASVVIPPTGANANALPVYATIYLQSNKASLRGEGKATLLCKTRSVCLFIGDRVNSNDFGGVEVSGIRFAAGNMFDGIPITNTACAAGVSTITLSNTGANAVVAGDWVDINWTFNQHYYGIHQVASASATQFTYADANCGGLTTIASQATVGYASLENAALEDDANGSDVHDIDVADATSSTSWGMWQNQVVVDNDQAFKLDAMNIDEGSHCTANYCGQAVYFPGPFSKNAGVAWLSHLNFGLQCGGNGVTDWAGNTLRIQNSVIQAFAQWGVFDGTMRGGYGGGEFDNVYEEAGGCVNPFYPGTGTQKAAMAGLVNSGGGNTIHGGEFPIGELPQFAASGNEGARYNYCFVVHDTSEGTSKCLTAGYALVDSASPAGSIVVAWPRVQGTGTVTYDVVRYSGTGNAAIPPYTGACGGGSTTACGSVATAVAQCATTLCSFTDSASASTTSYAVAAPSYMPGLFWLPGGIVTLTSADSQNFGTIPTFLDDNSVVTPVSPITTEAGEMAPQVFAQRCSNVNGNEWLSCLAGNSNGNASIPPATVLQYGETTGSPTAGLKGRLSFLSSQSASMASGEIVTLVDSNPAKTLATPGNRPTEDAADTYIGTDTGTASYNQVGMALGAPVSISSYINATPNGTGFLERLTSAGKTFNVPVTINGNLTVTGTCTGCGSGSGGGSGTVGSGTATQVAMYAANGTAVSGDAALTDNGTTLNYSGSGGITAATGTFSGNLTVNGQLNVAGPWLVSSPIPGTAMAAASAGTSALGISNDGNFYISASGGTPQKVATAATSSYFSNLQQEDANDVGQFTVGETAAQNLHVYSTYTNSSTYTRTSIGWDPASTYSVLRSEGSPAGTAPGLGFYVNNGVKWAIDANSEFKPWADGLYTIGTETPATGTGLRPSTVYVAGNSSSFSGFELGKFANESYELCNDATTGTMLEGLATLTTAGCAVKPTSAVTNGVIGVVIANAGTSGTATLVRTGSAYCAFDSGGAVAIGDYVTASSVVGSYFACHDAGSTLPSGQQILGRVLQTGAANQAAQMFFDMPGSNAGVSAVSSVFGRTGVVTAATGDYSVSQVTGAAPLASPTFTGTVTEPDGSTNTSSGYFFAHALTLPNGSTATTQTSTDNSTKVATDAFVQAVAAGFAPLASPTFTGTVTLPDGSTIGASAWTLSGKFPTLNQNTTGTAASLSAASALPNGTTATTQSAGDTSTKLATDGFVANSFAPLASPALTGTPSAPTAAAATNTTQVATTAYVVATEAGTYATWSAQIFGTTVASTGYGSWTTPAAITITGMDMYVATPPVGCTTYATVQIYDLTAAAIVGSYTMTLAASTNFYTHVSGSANVAASHNLTFRIGTAASGCSTNAANISPNLTYVMQTH